jgi:hypothetical protein
LRSAPDAREHVVGGGNIREKAYTRKKVPLRMAALCGIARREAGLTVHDAARIFEKGEATIGNLESCTYMPGDETVRRILEFYIARLGTAAPEGLPLEALEEKLGTALLLRYAARVGELVAAVESGGLDQALGFVIAHGLRADVVQSKFAERLRREIYQERFRKKREAEEAGRTTA